MPGQSAVIFILVIDRVLEESYIQTKRIRKLTLAHSYQPSEYVGVTNQTHGVKNL